MCELKSGILSLNKLAYIIHTPKNVIIDICQNGLMNYDPYIKHELKSNGKIKERTIDNPTHRLKIVQKRVNKYILSPMCLSLPNSMHGSLKGRSIKTNAAPHVGSAEILCLDLKDCFPSINASRVYKFYINEVGCSPKVAKVLTKITTYRNKLPQGACTSSSLCNLILAPMILELESIALKNNTPLSHYVDDITFSSMERGTLKKILPEVLEIISSHGYRINWKKLKITQNNNSMKVTDLTVNSKISPGRKYIRRLQRDISTSNNKKSVDGRINFVNSINENIGRKLQERNS